MKIIMLTILLAVMLAGCYQNNIVEKEYYENGALKREYSDTSTGFDPKWSAGNNKNLPLSNPQFSVIGK